MATVIHQIGAGYDEVYSLVNGDAVQPRVMQMLVNCYAALFDDLSSMFERAVLPGRMLLESSDRALAAGVVVRNPDGGFIFTGQGSSLKQATDALNRLTEKIGRSSPAIGSGCLIPLVAMLCLPASLMVIPLLLLWN